LSLLSLLSLLLSLLSLLSLLLLVLIKGINQSWIANSKWNDINYLKNKVKSSLSSTSNVIVPVEFGEHYMDENLQILQLDFLELLDFFELKTDNNNNNSNSNPKLYLAQFDINEIPGLVDDLKPLPEITKTGNGVIYRSNIWLGGSSGSISPCHNDPFHNILCQIYGSKRIILFPPDSKDHLYLYDQYHKQKNTSRVDFTNPDITKYPLFLEARKFNTNTNTNTNTHTNTNDNTK